MTITLPAFCKDLEKGLELGRVTDDLFPGFARTGGLPRFLGGFLRLVFDAQTGVLLDEPSIAAIHCLRQFLLMLGKVSVIPSDERVAQAMAGFIQTEQEVRASDAEVNSVVMSDFNRIARLLWAPVLALVENDVFAGQVTPKHGPGATADRLRGNAKFEQLEWTTRLETVFPSREYLIPNERFHETLDAVRFLDPRDERPVRVIAVPKTQKTPRIIAIEPTCMQYVQQGLLAVMKEKFRVDDNARNFVLFDSQEPNKALAKKGSSDRSLATLDLSEASDRVSYQHVLSLLSRNPALRAAIDAARSRKADVLGHGVIRLAKFASMGSALTFPIEALVFTTAVFMGIEKGLGHPLTKKDVRSFYGRVRVYGDDIIVPVDYVSPVIGSLEALGLKVNTGKSFWRGAFRESCGGDYYAGVDVSVVRMRRELPTSRKQADQVVSAVSLRNQLWQHGWTKTVALLDELLLGMIPFPFISSLDTPVLGRLTDTVVLADKWDHRLHIPLVKGMRVVAESPESNLDDYGALVKFFIKKGEQPIFDAEHLRRAGRPRSVRIKLGVGPVG
jgi:hypothetical protein